jgi:hypothetical protein
VDEPAEGFGDNGGLSAENSEWTVLNHRDPGSGVDNLTFHTNIGFHIIDPITAYISWITSTKTKVTPGYEGALSVTGDIAGATVADFLAMLDKADPGQTLHVINGEDTLSASDAIAADMVLSVVSLDGQNTSNYTLVNSPLSADNLLVATDESGLTVTLEEDEGSVSGVVSGATIAYLIDNLAVPAGAVLNVIDGDDVPVSLKTMNFDSTIVETTVGPNVFLEVVAENGDAAVYSLDFGYESSEAVLLSNVFGVDQALKVVRGLPEGITVSAILGLVYPNENATIMVVDNKGFPRTLGGLYSDDMVKVTSEDQSTAVYYNLNFLYVNSAPLVTVTGADAAETGKAISYTAAVSDDGLPEGSTLTYQWAITSGDEGTVTISAADQLDTDITFAAEGAFELSFTASDGALSTVVVSAISVTLGTGVALPDLSTINVYPNPANEFLFVDFGSLNVSGARVSIIDMVGSVVYNKSHFNNQAEIGLENLGKGMYFINISLDGHNTVRKLNVIK